MKILHICLVSHYTEGMLYQENVLVDLNIKDKHDVTIITDLWHYEGTQLIKTPPSTSKLKNGATLIRVKYDSILFSPFLSSKIQKVKILNDYLAQIKPDVILYHGVCGYELIDVANYCKSRPSCLFFVDSHEDYNNSARTFWSKQFYKKIHGIFVKKSISQIKKILYLAEESRIWLKDIYSIPDDKLEFYPTGGIIIPYEKQISVRSKIISMYHLNDDAIILAHSGKLSPSKRTEVLIHAFSKVMDSRLVLFIIGDIPDEMKQLLIPLINSDNRIHFLGWKSGNELEEFLSGVDLYCQPGSQSSTFETSACAGCAIMAYPYISYTDSSYGGDDPDRYIFVETQEDIENAIAAVSKDSSLLEKRKKKTYDYAKENFDYTKIARRILHE